MPLPMVQWLELFLQKVTDPSSGDIHHALRYESLNRLPSETPKWMLKIMRERVERKAAIEAEEKRLEEKREEERKKEEERIRKEEEATERAKERKIDEEAVAEQLEALARMSLDTRDTRQQSVPTIDASPDADKADKQDKQDKHMKKKEKQKRETEEKKELYAEQERQRIALTNGMFIPSDGRGDVQTLQELSTLSDNNPSIIATVQYKDTGYTADYVPYILYYID